MSSISASSDFSQVSPEDLARFLDIFGKDVVQTINGNLDFQTNFNAKLVSATFSSASTNTSITHNLGRSPAGYIICGCSAQMTISDGSGVRNTTTISLISSAPGTAIILFF